MKMWILYMSLDYLAQEGTIGQDRPLLIVWKRRFSVLAFLTVVGGLGVGEVFFYDFLRGLGIVEFLRARFLTFFAGELEGFFVEVDGVDGRLYAAGAVDVAEVHEAVVVVLEGVEHDFACHLFFQHDVSPLLALIARRHVRPGLRRRSALSWRARAVCAACAGGRATCGFSSQFLLVSIRLSFCESCLFGLS